MLRRDVRLRREYLYRKSLEEKNRAIYDRKQRVKNALDSGRELPSEIRNDSADLVKDLELDDGQAEPTNHMDDEYARAGVQDPKVMITTSRDPSSRLQQFAKELRIIFPNAQRVNRGNHVMSTLVGACKSNEMTDLIVIHEHRGVPDGLIISHFPYGPTAYFSLHNVVLRHDLPDQGTMSQAYPQLIFDGFSSKLGERTRNILKYLFPVPKEDSKRVITFANRSDYISFRHHVYVKTGGKHVELAEVGPRFEMKLYQIKLGTIDLSDADIEWALRPYMNTTKKRDFL